MTGTDLTIITPAARTCSAPASIARRRLRTNASTDHELLVLAEIAQDGSAHTLRAYNRAGRRFLAPLMARACAPVEDVQRALE